MTEHVYYLASQRRVIGDASSETIAILYATYVSHLNHASPGRYDGTSLFGTRLRTVVGCDGAGHGGHVIDQELSR